MHLIINLDKYKVLQQSKVYSAEKSRNTAQVKKSH